MFYILVALLSAFSLTDLFTGAFTKNALENAPRMVMIALSIVCIYRTSNKYSENADKRFLFYAAVFTITSVGLFGSVAHGHGELNEGGPMLVSAAIITLPMLHLGHKLILWSIMGAGLFVIQSLTGISLYWAIFYFIAITVIMIILQYQLDVLLRNQFRAQLVESEKAKTDKLTGLYNRYSFDTNFNKLLKNLAPTDTLWLAMLDIDYFKKYNDNYGHLEGDRVLVKVADLLSKQHADMVVRFGGEEFSLVKTGPTCDLPWLSDLPAQFQDLAIPHKYSPLSHVTVSVGVVSVSGSTEHVTTTALLTVADELMYHAKSTGRNRVTSQTYAHQDS